MFRHISKELKKREDGSHPTQAELQIVGKWSQESPAKPPQTATRLEDLQLIVAQTLERLHKLQRHRMESEWINSPMMVEAQAGEWMESGDMLDAIEDLRRAMGDCTLGEEGQR